MKKVGFWYSKHEPLLCMPIVSENKNEHSLEFINKCYEWIKLTRIINQYDISLMLRGSSISDERFIEYLSPAKCRLCDICNGNSEYHYNGFIFPEGIFHYIVKHNIIIDEDFKNMILKSELLNYRTLKLKTRTQFERHVTQYNGNSSLRHSL